MKYISDDQITNLNIEPTECLDWVKKSFLMKDKCILPHKVSIKFDSGEKFYNTMPVFMPEIDSSGVKIVSRYPKRKPSIEGDLFLYSIKNGHLLAHMAATWITVSRTGAVATLAVDTFSKSDYESIALIGLGAVMKSFLEIYCSDVKNKNKHIKVFEYKNHANLIKQYLEKKEFFNVTICKTYKELIVDSDVIISGITYTDQILGQDEWYKPGVLVVPIHTRGFQNCDLFFDKVFADDIDHVSDFSNFSKFKKFGEISDVLSGKIIGRENNEERILSYNIGIAIHDIFYAKKIYDLLA